MIDYNEFEELEDCDLDDEESLDPANADLDLEEFEHNTERNADYMENVDLLKWAESLPQTTDSLMKLVNKSFEFLDKIPKDSYDDLNLALSGKDSIATLHLCEKYFGKGNVPHTFVNTGIEFPTHIPFWKKHYPDINWVNSKHTQFDVYKNWGMPIVSKIISARLSMFKRAKSYKGEKPKTLLSLLGVGRNGEPMPHYFTLSRRWLFLLDEHDFPPPYVEGWSNKCCDKFKWDLKHGFNKIRFTGERACESRQRRLVFYQKGVHNNSHHGYTMFKPIAFWPDWAVTMYVELNHIPLPTSYTEYGLHRTGCNGCPFGMIYNNTQGYQNSIEIFREHFPVLYKHIMDTVGYRTAYQYMDIHIDDEKYLEELEDVRQRKIKWYENIEFHFTKVVKKKFKEVGYELTKEELKMMCKRYKMNWDVLQEEWYGKKRIEVSDIDALDVFSGMGSFEYAMNKALDISVGVSQIENNLTSLIANAYINGWKMDEYTFMTEDFVERWFNDGKIVMDTGKVYKQIPSKMLDVTYRALGGLDLEPDIYDFDERMKYDLVFYDIPVDDLNPGGSYKGLSGPKSSVIWELGRQLNRLEHKPSVLIMETSHEILNAQIKDDFEEWLGHLEKLGYTNIVLDNISPHTHAGVPITRKRVHVVSYIADRFNHDVGIGVRAFAHRIKRTTLKDYKDYEKLKTAVKNADIKHNFNKFKLVGNNKDFQTSNLYLNKFSSNTFDSLVTTDGLLRSPHRYMNEGSRIKQAIKWQIDGKVYAVDLKSKFKLMGFGPDVCDKIPLSETQKHIIIGQANQIDVLVGLIRSIYVEK